MKNAACCHNKNIPDQCDRVGQRGRLCLRTQRPRLPNLSRFRDLFFSKLKKNHLFQDSSYEYRVFKDSFYVALKGKSL